MRILLLGAHGQVGYDLTQFLRARTDYEVTALDRQQLELTDLDAVRSAVRTLAPDILINAAAYTAVDRAETEQDLARTLNARLPEALADECRSLRALFVHYSTDYVFDGTKKEPYLEDDPKNPINVYGQTKHEGDLAIQASGADHMILRVSWVYSPRGRNFLLTILRLESEGKPLRIVHDQVGTPTPSFLIADITQQLITRRDRPVGTYHLAPSESTSWAGFAREILRLSGSPAQVTPIPSSEYPTPAKRPQNSVFSTGLLRTTFQLALPSWQRGLAQVMEEVKGTRTA